MSGGGYNVNDAAFLGYAVERDERTVGLPFLSVRRAVTVDGRQPSTGLLNIKDATLGDYQPRLLWPNDLTKRPFPSYGAAWAATVTASDKDPRPPAGQSAPPGFAQFATPGGGNPFGGIVQPNTRPGGIGVPGAFGGVVGGTGIVGSQFGGSFGGFGIQGGTPPGGVTQGGKIGSAQVGAGAKNNGRTYTGAQGGAQLMHVRPIRDRGTVEDDRYEHIVSPDRPVWSSRFPKGWTGAMLCTSREEQQDEVFIPGAHALVGASAPGADPLLGSAVVGTDPKTDKVDPERRAVLTDFLRVVKRPSGVPGNALSWHIGLDPARPYQSGFVTDYDYGDGLKTVGRNDPIPLVHGHVIGNALAAGPFLVGPSNDLHAHPTRDGDGFVINPLHLNTSAVYRSLNDNVRDGPIDFQFRDMPRLTTGPSCMPVHLVWNAGGGSNRARPSTWGFYAESAVETEGGPPDDPGGGRIPTPGGGSGQPPRSPVPTPTPPTPPTPGPSGGGEDDDNPVNELPPGFVPLGSGPGRRKRQKRRVGPSRLEDRDKAIATTGMELAAPTFLLRPATWGCGAEDVRNSLRPSADARARRKRDPIIGALHTAWAKTGGACNPWGPTYTTRPGAGPYPGGTASGIACWMPPEVTLGDYSTTYAPGGITRSSLIVAALKGSVLWGSGVPNPTTALLESGATWGANSSSGAFEVKHTDSAGAVSSTSTLPKRTGNIVQAPSALTANYIPRADANGDLVVSAVSDDGSNVLAARDGLVLGVAQDVQVSSAGAGLLKISDYTGGTGASLIFAAATSGHPRLRANSNTLETKLGDNSGYAKHVANVLESKVATGTAPLIVASTTVVANLNADTVDGYEGAALATPADNVFRIVGSSDATKKLAFEVDGISTGTTRTYTAPDRSGTITLGDGSLGLGEIPEGDSNGDLTASGLTSQVITRLFSPASQTASNGGNYSVAAGVGTTFVDASALTAGQNYDVTLPSAVTYSGRRSTVKITTAGAGGATVTVKSSAGTVEGVAAATGVPLDASARSKVTYQSDGTNWWSV